MGSNKRHIEHILLIALVGIIVGITAIPYFEKGLSGHIGDLMYHLQRIEAVKDALESNEYPVGVYARFLYGYGYGSPLFYPDLFLVYPALLRVFGVSVISTWKIFALTITTLASLSTYFSLKYICKKSEAAIAGTFLLMLSQFYLADLINRVGISEYLAYIFLPMLFAGIYDFFEYEGKKTWLFGVAFWGMLFSHAIMTFLGVMFTSAVFLIAFFIPKWRVVYHDVQRIKRLVVTAIFTVLVSAGYIFPMLEQMKSGKFFYQEPWICVSEAVQDVETLFLLKGYFDITAYVGVGFPILVVLMLFGRDMLLVKKTGLSGGIFLYIGLGMFLCTTKIFPWHLLDKTIFNMIQMPYRLYPYALCALVMGIVLHISEKYYNNNMKRISFFIIFLSVSFGILQNKNYEILELTKGIDEKFLDENTGYAIGMGEWLPLDVDLENLSSGKLPQTVVIESSGEEEVFLNSPNEFCYKFQAVSLEEEIYQIPLIYYKGYCATISSETSDTCGLELLRTETDLIEVRKPAGYQGIIEIWYEGTVLQKVSKIITWCTIFLLLVMTGFVKYKEEITGFIAYVCDLQNMGE